MPRQTFGNCWLLVFLLPRNKEFLVTDIFYQVGSLLDSYNNTSFGLSKTNKLMNKNSKTNRTNTTSHVQYIKNRLVIILSPIHASSVLLRNSRLVFSRFFDFQRNLRNVIKEKPTRKTCFSRKMKRLSLRIYLAKFCLEAFL